RRSTIRMIVGAAVGKYGESASKISHRRAMGDHRPSALISTASGSERGYITKPRSLTLAVLIFLTCSRYDFYKPLALLISEHFLRNFFPPSGVLVLISPTSSY